MTYDEEWLCVYTFFMAIKMLGLGKRPDLAVNHILIRLRRLREQEES
jgi:hypothetical protein